MSKSLEEIKKTEKQTAVITYRTYPSIKKYLEGLAEKKEWALNRFMAWQTEEAYRVVTEKKP